jgi:cytochrome c biogenesis protein CcdA
MIFALILIGWLLVGFICVFVFRKYIRLSFRNPNVSPFWQGFLFGLFQCSSAILFPVLIYDWYQWYKNEKS